MTVFSTVVRIRPEPSLEKVRSDVRPRKMTNVTVFLVSNLGPRQLLVEGAVPGT